MQKALHGDMRARARTRRVPKAGLALAAFFSVLALYGFWYEPSSLRTAFYPLTLDRENALSATPLRIAVISDLHGGAPYIGEDKIGRVVTLTNDAKPDLILLTGDYVIKNVAGGTPMPIETIVAHLKALHAPLGVYAILGNHDQWIDPGNETRVFQAAGIPVLDDKNVILKRGGETIPLAGISDYRTAPHNVMAALNGVSPAAHAICFTHSPDVFPELPKTCSLTVAGHTHGGQVWLPFIGRPVVPSEYGERYAVGLVHENGKYVFVSTGIGTSIMPVRFGVPPEISILDIRTRQD
jgi:uncharacterized protein